MFSGANECLSEKPLHRVKTEVATFLSLKKSKKLRKVQPVPGPIKLSPFISLLGVKEQ